MNFSVQIVIKISDSFIVFKCIIKNYWYRVQSLLVFLDVIKMIYRKKVLHVISSDCFDT